MLIPLMTGLIGYGSDEEEEREKKRDDSRAGMEVRSTCQITILLDLIC